MKYLLSKIERKSLGNFILIILTAFSGFHVFAQAPITLPDCCSPSIKIGEVYWSGCNLHSSIVAPTANKGGVDFYDANKVTTDPCPTGWRMSELNDFLTISYGKIKFSSSGVFYDNGLLLNDTGYLDASNNLQKSHIGYYWIGGTNKIFNTATNGSENAIVNGKYSIRCVQGAKITTAPTKPTTPALPDFKGCPKSSSVVIGQVLWAGCDLNSHVLAGSICGKGTTQYKYSDAKSGCESQGWRLPTRYEFETFSAMNPLSDNVNKNWTYILPDGQQIVLKYGYGGVCSGGDNSDVAYTTGPEKNGYLDYFNSPSSGFGNTNTGVLINVRCVADIDNLPKDGNAPSSGNEINSFCTNEDVLIGNVIWAGCDITSSVAAANLNCNYNSIYYDGYNWGNANNACQSKGWRLPTQVEITDLAALTPTNNASTNSWDYNINGSVLKMYKGVSDSGCANNGINLSYWGSSNYNGNASQKVILYTNSASKPRVDQNGYPNNNRYGAVRCVKDLDNTEVFLGCEYGSSVKIGNTLWAGCDVTPAVKSPNSTCNHAGGPYYMYKYAESVTACQNVGWRLPNLSEVNALLAITPTYVAATRTWDYVVGSKTLKLFNGGWNYNCVSSGDLLRYHFETTDLLTNDNITPPEKTNIITVSEYVTRCVKTVN